MVKKISIIRTVFEGTFWTSIFGVLTKIIAMITAVLVLSHLSITEYGLSELAMSVVAFLSIFMLPGMIQVIVADMSTALGKEDYGRAREIGKNFFKLQSMLCGVAFLILLIISIFATKFFTSNVSGSLQILSLLFLISPIRGFFTLIFSVTKNFFAQGALSFLEELVRFAIISYCFNFTELRLEGVFLGGIGGPIISMLLLLSSFKNSYRPIRESLLTRTAPFFESILNHGKWSVFSSYFNTFGQNMRLWIVQAFLGTGAVGVVSLAFNLLSHTQSLISFSSILSPLISEHQEDKRLVNTMVAKAIKYQMFIFIFTGTIFFFGMPVLVGALFPKYLLALPLYKLLLFSMIPASFAVVFTPMFHAKKEQKSLFNAIMTKNVAIALGSLVFLPVFGIIGASFEYLVTLTYFLYERYKFLKKIYTGFSISWSSFFSFDEIDRRLLSKFFMNFKNNVK